MQTTKFLILAAFAALTLPAFALAQKGSGNGKPDPGRVIRILDQNGDGAISKTEAQAAPRGRLDQAFDRIDRDADGLLSAGELSAAREAVKRRAGGKGTRFRNADTDGSRTLSFDEAKAAAMPRLLDNFDRIDADGDGEVTPQEIRAAVPKGRQGPRPERKGPNHSLSR